MARSREKDASPADDSMEPIRAVWLRAPVQPPSHPPRDPSNLDLPVPKSSPFEEPSTLKAPRNPANDEYESRGEHNRGDGPSRLH